MPETAETAKGIPKARSWLPLLGNAMPEVSGGHWRVFRTVAASHNCVLRLPAGELPEFAAFFPKRERTDTTRRSFHCSFRHCDVLVLPMNVHQPPKLGYISLFQ